MRGRVKWWNDTKGFGFIAVDGLEDVFVHYLDVQTEDRPMLLEDEVVELNIGTTAKGLKAERVVRQSQLDAAKEEPLKEPEEYVAMAHIGGKVRLIALTPDGRYSFLDEAETLHTILYTNPSETLAFQSALDELETLINSTSAAERDFQDFFERHPDFILNEDYQRAVPHVVLADDNGQHLIPDFVLEPVDQAGLCDLLELKLPSARVYALTGGRLRFSAAVLEACAQLREYSMFFDEERNRTRVREKYGLTAFHPHMFVIIGRRGSVSPIDLRKIETDVPHLRLRTYDDIINRNRARLERMRKGGTKR